MAGPIYRVVTDGIDFRVEEIGWMGRWRPVAEDGRILEFKTLERANEFKRTLEEISTENQRRTQWHPV